MNEDEYTITPFGYWKGDKPKFQKYPELNVDEMPSWLANYFKENTNVAGIILSKIGDDYIPYDEDKNVAEYKSGEKMFALNPFSNLNEQQKEAVAMNESFRQYMEDINFVPKFNLSKEQQDARKTVFKDSPYNKYLDNYKKTLLARIFSGDNAFNPTEEQKNMVKILMEDEKVIMEDR